MEKIILYILLIVTICSCSSEATNTKVISDKSYMDSWAWKIFIFTDEGETKLYETKNNNYDNSLKVNPIFVEDVLGIYNNDDLFLDKNKERNQVAIINPKFFEYRKEK